MPKNVEVKCGSYDNIAKLLYVGEGYEQYTDEDIEKLVNSPTVGSNEFVLNNIITNFGFREAITQADIDSITVPGSTAYNYCGNRDRAVIQGEVQTAYNNAPVSRTLQSYTDDQLKLAKKIYQKNDQAKLWFAIPIVCTNLAYKYNDILRTLLVDYVKAKVTSDISPDYWEENVYGFYYAREAVVSGYTPFVTTNPADFQNPVVNNMISVSSYVHGLGKKMLWIPYYRSDAESVTRLAYILGTKDIFDFADLQPNYFFDASLTNNIALVDKCVEHNNIVDANGNDVVAKTSGTQIGAEMEIDSRYISDVNYHARYEDYLTAYSKYRGIKHFSFYFASKLTIFPTTGSTVIFDTVRSFCTYS